MRTGSIVRKIISFLLYDERHVVMWIEHNDLYSELEASCWISAGCGALRFVINPIYKFNDARIPFAY